MLFRFEIGRFIGFSALSQVLVVDVFACGRADGAPHVLMLFRFEIGRFIGFSALSRVLVVDVFACGRADGAPWVSLPHFGKVMA